MESPLPPLPLAAAGATVAGVGAPATTPNVGYPESVESSPRSRNADSWDEPIPYVPGAKLRLMCSYGGHIVPRPHDKSLCYIGGDTRIIVVNRNSTLADLCGRLSRSLLNGRSFTLKYQLPNEELDSLISVTTDEDLDNMIEEYDRTSASSLKSSRLRLFLFPTKPETSSSIGSLLDDSKSETWFVDALNSSGILPRGLSADAASVSCLLSLDDGIRVDSAAYVEAQTESLSSNKQIKHAQDVHSMPDSPMMDTTSSFGSTSSSPSMSNLPPIRVRVEDGGFRLQDQKVGLEEQFSQMVMGVAPTVQKQSEGFVVLSAPPPLPTTTTAATVSSAAAASENPNRILSSDDERSEHGAPIGLRKPPQPPQQMQQKPGYAIDLSSPDSVSSDNSIANAISRSKPPFYQDQNFQVASGDNRVSANPVDPKSNVTDPNSWIQLQQVHQDSGYVLPPQLDQQQQQQQQQFVPTNTHYIHHPASGPVPISSYYSMYPPHQQQHLHPQFDQSYPMYMMQVRSNQPYNLSMQSTMGDTSTITSSRPPTPPTASMVPPPGAYKDSPAPLYNTKSAPLPKHDLASGAYRTPTAAVPPLVQVPSNQHQQHQQQYVGFHQLHHPSQSVAAAANYAYEYADPAHAQMYYTQPHATTLPPQYQTMTSAAAVMLSEASTQLSTDNTKQQVRTSQPM